MSDFYKFYREILGELDFSIIGYKSISETINNFFHEISESSLLNDLSNLDFISYSYAQVSDINTWKLSPMSSEYPFYYKSFSDEKRLLYTLSLYYDFKDFLKPLHGGGTSRLIVSEIISKVFNRPTPYRVKISETRQSSVCYDEHLDIITFNISLQSLIKKKSIITLHELTANILNRIVKNDLNPRLEKKENTFKIKNRRMLGDLFFEKIFDKKKIEVEIERLAKKSKKITCGNGINIINTSFGHDDSIIKEWIKVIFGHGFLSILSNRWVENIPSVTKVEGNESQVSIKKSIGTLIIGYATEYEIDSSERALFRMIADKVSSVVTAQVVKDINEELLSQAKSSAISKVMSRNMSHNIGSHVLSRLAKKNSKEQLANSDISFSKDDLANFGHFFSYLMRRMDFLADIATTVPVMTTTCEFVQDILNPFKNSIFIKKYITGNDLSFDIYPASKGLYVLIPNDILGKHAIYTIFENVIRNTAKHGNHKEDKFNIDITLSEDERNPDHIKVTIFDDCENKDVIKIVNDLNRKINLPLLDHNNTLRKEAWGILEMKIAAAYLRKIPLNSIDDTKWDTTETNNKTASLLKAVVVDEGYLGYEFYLLRPKEGVIVHPDKVIKKTNFGEDLEKGSFDDYEELSGFSIIGYQQQALSASDVTYFESNPGKFTRRLLRNFESGHDLTMSVETLWISWLQAAAQKKGVKNIIIHYESDETNATTIDSLNIAEEGRILNAVFVHHPKNELPAGDYVESITNKSQFYQFKNSVNTSKQFKFHLIEGILTNIILLDERIQEFTTESVLDDSIPINLQQYYERLGIFVPAREAIWLNDPYSADYREKVESWLIEHLSEADFFVVHIGVLEKLLQLSNYPDSEKIYQIESFIQHLSKFLPDIFAKIVFISGRGRPDTIPAKYRFLNYSNIDQLLEKRICKATLTGLLYSARSYEEMT